MGDYGPRDGVYRLPDSHTIRAQAADLERRAAELAKAPAIDTAEALRVAQFMSDRHWEELVEANERHIKAARDSFWIGMGIGLFFAAAATTVIVISNTGG